jgi:hypothetical protein
MKKNLFSLLTMLTLLVVYGPAFAHVIDFTVDPEGTVSEGGGEVTLTGTIKCTPYEWAYLNANVIQIIKGKIVSSAYGYTSFVCDGSTQSWTITLLSYIGQKSGPANVVAYANTYDDGYHNESIATEVKLHKQ